MSSPSALARIMLDKKLIFAASNPEPRRYFLSLKMMKMMKMMGITTLGTIVHVKESELEDLYLRYLFLTSEA